MVDAAMPMKHNLLGKRHNRLVGIEHLGKGNWRLQCDCGNTTTANAWQVVNSQVQSCGCLYRSGMKHHRKHGHAGKKQSSEYRSWSEAKKRCFNVNSQRYPLYGGRGITMCAEWRDSFAAFIRDVGPKPSRHHSLDRINVDGHYEPGNVRWANQRTQTRNSRRCPRFAFNGQELTSAEWSVITGIPAYLIRHRIQRYGWTIERALTEKPLPSGGHWRQKREQRLSG